MENQQGPVVQPRELCSILCDNLMVTRVKGGGRDSQGVWDGHGHATIILHGEPARTCWAAQGTLLNVPWQPGWEGSLGEKGYM